MSILSFLPLLFLSQRLVYVTVVFVVIIIWLLISSSFHSWCYWVFLFVNKIYILIFICLYITFSNNPRMQILLVYHRRAIASLVYFNPSLPLFVNLFFRSCRIRSRSWISCHRLSIRNVWFAFFSLFWIVELRKWKDASNISIHISRSTTESASSSSFDNKNNGEFVNGHYINKK